MDLRIITSWEVTIRHRRFGELVMELRSPRSVKFGMWVFRPALENEAAWNFDARSFLALFWKRVVSQLLESNVEPSFEGILPLSCSTNHRSPSGRSCVN